MIMTQKMSQMVPEIMLQKLFVTLKARLVNVTLIQKLGKIGQDSAILNWVFMSFIVKTLQKILNRHRGQYVT